MGRGGTGGTRARIPEQLDEIDAAWLSAALSIVSPGTEVASLEHGSVVHGSLTKVALRCAYAANPAGLPTTLYVKGAFEDHGIPVSMLSEAAFYAVARPLVDVRAPACFAALHDDAQGVVVLEDLTAAGATITDPTRGWSPDAVADGLLQLAGLHARWWGAGAVPGMPVVAGSNALGAVLMAEGYWEACVAGPAGARLPERFVDRRTVAPWIQSLWMLDTQPPRCFLHGDAHLGNTYVDAGGRPGFLDWGGVTAGHWAREVCYFLAGALTPDDRRTNETDLLRLYLDALGTEVHDTPSWEEAWLDYRRHLLHGLLWFLCPPEMQPIEVIDANVQRFSAACIDHDVDRLFG